MIIQSINMHFSHQTGKYIPHIQITCFLWNTGINGSTVAVVICPSNSLFSHQALLRGSGLDYCWNVLLPILGDGRVMRALSLLLSSSAAALSFFFCRRPRPLHAIGPMTERHQRVPAWSNIVPLSTVPSLQKGSILSVVCVNSTRILWWDCYWSGWFIYHNVCP